MNSLTNKQQDFCGYCGTFGALLSLTCLVQHLVISNVHWISFTLLGMYLFVAVSFILLAFQKSIAPALLIISCIVAFFAEATLIISFVFSVAVVLLFVYTVVITIVIYIEGLQKGLKEKALLIKAEREAWEGKI